MTVGGIISAVENCADGAFLCAETILLTEIAALVQGDA